MPFVKRKGHWKRDCPKLNKSKMESRSEANVVRSDGNDSDSSCYSLSITDQVVIWMRLSGYWMRALLTTFVSEGSCLLALRSWIAV